MISKLSIKNFKAHSATTLDLSNLNILTGINGVGKSSVFQSLLLLRQSFENKVLASGLQLNKPHCYIGTIEDAIYQYADSETIEFTIESLGHSHCWRFKPEKNDLTADFIPVTDSIPKTFESINIFTDKFQYLSALRSAKSESNTFSVESRRQMSLDRGQGELIAHFLFYWGKEKREKIKSEYLKHPSTESLDLIDQVSAWEREISPNVNVVPTRSSGSFEIKYSFQKEGDVTGEFKSENVGFGLGYSLPIVVAALSSEPGAILLIENPEAHLHPRGQSQLAKLLALTAQSGVQIILETHSEHIMNGVLVACKKNEEGEPGIDKGNVRIYHFLRDAHKHSAAAYPVQILQGGKIDTQPQDFFEQTEKDLKYLMGF